MSPPLRKIDISAFLELSAAFPVVDVRSPGEFVAGHIPKAVNIPLFSDSEREIVGTLYKKEGRTNAILAGIALTGPSMSSKLKQALDIARGGKLLVHCWRGGMRSEAMAWLFSLGDIETEILDGGYKAYRHHVRVCLGEKRDYLVLGGLTGSGKTALLAAMKDLGHQVIDLEGIACHRGSAFGSLGQLPQPTSEHFANLLYDELRKTDRNRPVWLEDESRNIGSVFMPDQFWLNMQDSPVIALLMDVRMRLPRLLREYSGHPKDELMNSVKRLSKRLGGDNVREAITSIESGDFVRAVEITLNYYDKLYVFGFKKRPDSKIRYVETDTDDVTANAAKVVRAAEEFRVGPIDRPSITSKPATVRP